MKWPAKPKVITAFLVTGEICQLCSTRIFFCAAGTVKYQPPKRQSVVKQQALQGSSGPLLLPSASCLCPHLDLPSPSAFHVFYHIFHPTWKQCSLLSPTLSA